jgi:3-deoxy-manno-octulosonate cytidylyltransferase (CMP-KDO synthetase)
MDLQKPKVLGVIPARIGSTRLRGKMLADIYGKTLIRRTYERSTEAHLLDALIIATDSDEIEAEARSFGASVVRSTADCKNGTERADNALLSFTDFVPDVVAIIWGDEPLYPASVIDACVQMFIDGKAFDAVTAAFKIYDLQMVVSDSVGKVVTDKQNKMLYLSRSPVPYNFTTASVDYYHSSGVMVMGREFLKKYNTMEQTPLELIEGVEQLRILENGYSLGVVKSDFENIGVNTPEDLVKVIRIAEQVDSLKR